MAKYFDDFEGESLGVTPSNWTPQWAAGSATWVTATDGGSPSDIYVRGTASSTFLAMLEFDLVSGDSERANAQVLARFRPTGILTTFGITIRGTSAPVNGYVFHARTNQTGLSIGEVSGGQTATSYSAFGLPAITASGTWYWMKVQAYDGRLMAKMWEDGDPEPSYQIILSDTTFTSAGQIGIFVDAASGTPILDCSFFSVGTGDDPADLVADEVGVRASQSLMQVVNAIEGDTRLTQTALQAVTQLNDDTRLTQTAALVLLGDQSIEARLTQTAVLVLTTTSPCETRWTQTCKITRKDGQVFRFTTLDVDFTYGGETYLTCGGMRTSASENTATLDSAGNMDLNLLINSDHIADQELLNGLFDGAEVEIWNRPWEAVEGDVPFRIIAGEFGKVSKGTAGFKVEVITKAGRAAQQNLLEIYTPNCRWDLGSVECTVDLDALEVSGSVTSTALVTGPSVSRKRAFIDTSRTEESNYFDYGSVTWTSGDNTGTTNQIERQTGNSFLLWDTAPYRIQVGDTYTMKPGCDKAVDTCKTKFNNFINYGGFPHVPGTDGILAVTTRKTNTGGKK